MLCMTDPSHDTEVRDFVQSRIGVPATADLTAVIGVEDNRELVGGWMFERYTGVGGSAHVHWAALPGRRWLSRGILAAVAIYAFDQLKVNTLFGEVRASDQHVRDLDERMGFVEVAVLTSYFPDDDLILYSLTKAGCPWLPTAYKEHKNG